MCNKRMEIGSKVKLITFNGEDSSSIKCAAEENYWLLIGKAGVVVKPQNKRGRVLVKFDEAINDLGLYCHNEEPNSLLVLASDLEVLNK